MRLILRAVFAVVLMLCAAGASLAGDLQKQFSLSGSFGNNELVQFDVATDGNIVIEAEWTGQATDLALILNGPGQTKSYARKDGKSVLRVEYKVTQADIAKGKTWVATITNFSNKGPANGTMRIWHPKPDNFAARCIGNNNSIIVNVNMAKGSADLTLLFHRLVYLTPKYMMSVGDTKNIIALAFPTGVIMQINKNKKTLSYVHTGKDAGETPEICKLDIDYKD